MKSIKDVLAVIVGLGSAAGAIFYFYKFVSRPLEELIGKLKQFALDHQADPSLDVATFKDLAGVSRKYAIPLLEFLDRERITRRAGDRRVILK